MSGSLPGAVARTMLAFALALLAAALVAVMLASPARAATFTVNQSGDAVDTNTGGTFDGACDTDAGTTGDQCTLRAAIQEANASTTVDDVIDFSVGAVTLAIGGRGEESAARGDLDIRNSVTINGGGVVIGTTATFNERLFHIVSPAEATVSDATLQGGREEKGAGFYVASGATLDLSGSTLRDNRIEGFFVANGAGIYVESGGTLSVTDSTFTENVAEDNGGGIYNAGGTLNVTDSTFDTNTAQKEHGGGVYNAGGTLNVTDSTFDTNTAERDGGGIRNAGGTLTVTGTTFTENVTNFWSGGGLAVTGGTATLTNSTISGNTTFGEPASAAADRDDAGGGVAVVGGTLSLTNVTIAGNRAPNSFGGGISNITGSATAVEARNTIVANNTQGLNGQCATSKTTSGGVTSLGGNLEFPGNSCIFEVAADPKLGSLADNGGPTQTRALGEGSAAIDAGTNTGCPATDQRDVSRPQDGDEDNTATCDIGAVEVDLVEVSINDAQVTEGDSGLRPIAFTVSLDAATTRPVSVDYATGGGTATADVDYASKSGTLTFAPGETAKQVSVPVGGDTLDEPDETFNVNLSNPSSEAAIADNQGEGTIVDDDAAPSLAISDAFVNEGNSGATNAVFTVTRSGDASGASSVGYATQNGSATAPGDYAATSGTLNFAAGQTTKQIPVAVNGDTTAEPNEGFEVELTAPSSGTTISDNEGVGTILNDDGSGGDSSKPVVIRTIPRDGATGVALGANVSSYFSEAMEAGTINQDTVKLFRKQGSTLTRLPAAVTYDAANKRAILNPNANLVRGATYLCSITSGAQDLAANPLDQDPNKDDNQNKRFTFTTRR